RAVAARWAGLTAVRLPGGQSPRLSAQQRLAPFAAHRVGQADDLPPFRGTHELERVDAAVAELRALVEGVLRPYRGEGALDPDDGVEEPLVPRVGRTADGEDEAVDPGDRDRRLAGADAGPDQSGLRMEDRSDQGAVRRAHPVEESLDDLEHLSLFRRLRRGRRRGEAGPDRGGEQHRPEGGRRDLRITWSHVHFLRGGSVARRSPPVAMDRMHGALAAAVIPSHECPPMGCLRGIRVALRRDVRWNSAVERRAGARAGAGAGAAAIARVRDGARRSRMLATVRI